MFLYPKYVWWGSVLVSRFLAVQDTAIWLPTFLRDPQAHSWGLIILGSIFFLSGFCVVSQQNEYSKRPVRQIISLAEASQEKSRWMLSLSMIIMSLVRGQSPFSLPGSSPAPGRSHSSSAAPPAQRAWSRSLHSEREASYFWVHMWEGWEDGKKSEKMYVSKYFKEKRGKLIFKQLDKTINEILPDPQVNSRSGSLGSQGDTNFCQFPSQLPHPPPPKKSSGKCSQLDPISPV